jgi:hypothetical protein
MKTDKHRYRLRQLMAEGHTENQTGTHTGIQRETKKGQQTQRKTEAGRDSWRKTNRWREGAYKHIQRETDKHRQT